MIWYCQHCGALADGGELAGRCEGCGGPTARVCVGDAARQEPAVQIPPALAEVWLLRLAAMESHAESVAAMAKAMKQMVASLAAPQGE